jgi:CubicO group peptidase (beta-lactamase class C family)
MPARQVSARHARRITILLAGLVAVALSGCVVSPPDPIEAVAGSSPSDADTKSALARDVRTTFASGEERAAVAVIEDGDVMTVSERADEDTVFEIGTISMVLIGELLAMAIERGEVALDDPLGAYLPLGDSPAASVTLQSVATHRSGLPFEPTDPEWVAAAEAAIADGRTPYTSSLEELVDLASGEQVAPGGPLSYSNLAAALLGHALAAAAGTDYATLLEERLFAPLGMDQAVLVESPEQVPEAHAGGYSAPGRPAEPWSWAAFSPAGAVHATLDDLVALAQAVLDGPLSESAALEPIALGGHGAEHLGYFW